MKTVDELLELAKRLAVEAASFTKSLGGRTSSQRKTDRTVVTEVDHAIQAHLLSAIAERFPDHAVVAEETVATPGAHADRLTARFCWVIDPLDGTRNFVAGFPSYATSIAVLERGEPIVGVVIDHIVGAIYAGARGQGATLNGAPLRMSEPAPGEDWLIGFASTKDQPTVDVVRNWLGTRGYILRNTGSTALHLGMVAAGALTAAFCRKCKIWDVAAGALLIREAGGIITDAAGSPMDRFDLRGDMGRDVPFLAGTPKTHPVLLRGVLQQ